MATLTLDGIRRECIRIGSQLKQTDTALRDQVAAIQVKADGLSVAEATPAVLDQLNTDLQAVAAKIS